MNFKDITPHCVVKLEENCGEFSSGEYKVESVGVATWGDKENYIELHTGADDWGESDGYLEKLTESEFKEGGGTVIHWTTDKQKEVISELDALISSMEDMSRTIAKKAKENKLDYDVVVLSATDDLTEWYSSRC